MDEQQYAHYLDVAERLLETGDVLDVEAASIILNGMGSYSVRWSTLTDRAREAARLIAAQYGNRAVAGPDELGPNHMPVSYHVPEARVDLKVRARFLKRFNKGVSVVQLLDGDVPYFKRQGENGGISATQSMDIWMVPDGEEFWVTIANPTADSYYQMQFTEVERVPKGLYAKYEVLHAQTRQKVEGGTFVLKPDKDVAARMALALYAVICKWKNAALAEDLEIWLNALDEQNPLFSGEDNRDFMVVSTHQLGLADDVVNGLVQREEELEERLGQAVETERKPMHERIAEWGSPEAASRVLGEHWAAFHRLQKEQEADYARLGRWVETVWQSKHYHRK